MVPDSSQSLWPGPPSARTAHLPSAGGPTPGTVNAKPSTIAGCDTKEHYLFLFFFTVLIQVARGQFEFEFAKLEAKITRLQVSLTVGTGRRGSEFWKLYSIGFLPENTFTNNWKRRTKKKKKECWTKYFQVNPSTGDDAKLTH